MTALRRHRAPVLVGLAPLLLLILLLPAPHPASAALIPPTPGQEGRDPAREPQRPPVTYVVQAFAAYTNRQPHTGQGCELNTGVEMVNGSGSLTAVGDVYSVWPRPGNSQMR